MHEHAAPEPGAGRFAPSPTGRLHVGNLRTALVAWLAARAAGDRFVVRMEDLDRVTSSRHWEAEQLAELAMLGLDHDGEVVRQSERFDRYHDAIASLRSAGLVYECWCTRREIREAVAAPNGVALPGYPGTCRAVPAAVAAQHRTSGRRPALRLRAATNLPVEVVDAVHGPHRDVPDDVVLLRNDGVPAYNLVVVVDDAAQGITTVVRGDDLLSITPSQAHLADLLGLPRVHTAHVPLVLGADGERLAKRHGAVTLEDLVALGATPRSVRGLLARSLGLAGAGEEPTPGELVGRFDLRSIPREPWVLTVEDLAACGAVTR